MNYRNRKNFFQWINNNMECLFLKKNNNKLKFAQNFKYPRMFCCKNFTIEKIFLLHSILRDVSYCFQINDILCSKFFYMDFILRKMSVLTAVLTCVLSPSSFEFIWTMGYFWQTLLYNSHTFMNYLALLIVYITKSPKLFTSHQNWFSCKIQSFSF